MNNFEYITKDIKTLTKFIDDLKCHYAIECEKCNCIDYCFDIKKNNLTTEEWLLKDREVAE